MSVKWILIMMNRQKVYEACELGPVICREKLGLVQLRLMQTAELEMSIK